MHYFMKTIKVKLSIIVHTVCGLPKQIKMFHGAFLFVFDQVEALLADTFFAREILLYAQYS